MNVKSKRKHYPGVMSKSPVFNTANEPLAAQPIANSFFKKTTPPTIHIQPTSAPIIQRQETDNTENTPTEKKDKDPLTEGLKTTGKQLLKNPQFKLWYKPKLEFLKDTLWENQSTEVKAALITYGVLSLGAAGAAFSQNPKMQEALSGVNIGTPLGWIPYSPIEGFKYTLPEAGKSDYKFSADFTFKPYLELLSKRFPNQPLTGATFGLDTRYSPDQGLSVTGGKFGLDFWGGGLKAEGKTFTELSPYPQMMLGDQPGMPPSWLMQSVPGLPPIQTGPGFQFMLTVDFAKLVNRLSKDNKK